MEKIDNCLRSWRRKLKKKYYKPEEKSMEELLVQPDNRVDPDQWMNIVRRWESKEGKVM